MSWKCKDWAAEVDVVIGDEKHAPCGRKFVLFMLASHSRHDGSGWLPQSKLATYTGQSERAVRGHLAALEGAHFIKRYERRSKRGGHRLADGWLLDPLTIHGIDRYIDDPESLIDRETPGREKARNRAVDTSALPAESAGRPSGKDCRPYRQESSVLPADSAGIQEQDSLNAYNESSPAEGSAGAPAVAATSDEAATAAASEEQQGDQAQRERMQSAYAFWKAHAHDLAEYFGGAWGAWLEPLIPLRYDGTKIVLGAWNDFAANKINGALGGPATEQDQAARSYREQLAEQLGIEVEVVVYNLGAVHTKRRVERVKAERERYLDEGEEQS